MPDPVSLLSRAHSDLSAVGGRRRSRPGPVVASSAEVRVLEGLLGSALPDRWDDVTAARRGTGREPLTAADRLQRGPGARRFPLFG